MHPYRLWKRKAAHVEGGAFRKKHILNGNKCSSERAAAAPSSLLINSVAARMTRAHQSTAASRSAGARAALKKSVASTSWLQKSIDSSLSKCSFGTLNLCDCYLSCCRRFQTFPPDRIAAIWKGGREEKREEGRRKERKMKNKR